MLAVIAKGFTYHSSHSTYLNSLQDQQCLLLFCIIHTINCKQGLAAPADTTATVDSLEMLRFVSSALMLMG